MEGESKRECRDENSYLETMERWFWQHIEYQMAQTGETEQEVLDAIKTPGFTGRKARQVGSGNERRAEMGNG
jgi:hypothetical protein